MILNQLHAIGDILFCEPIFRYYWKRDGVKPTVPIRDHLIWMANHIESANFVKESTCKASGIDLESLQVTESYIPLRWANQIFRGYDPNDHHDFENMMLDKYRLCGLDPMLWKTLQINFSIPKTPPISKSYAVVNKYSQAGELQQTHCHLSNVYYMNSNMAYFDWIKYMWFAKENHHISTSTFFVFQAMINKGWKQSKIILYPRPNADGLRGISQLNPDFDYETL